MLLTIALTALGLVATPRGDDPVATTRHFAFESDARVNLHDALNRFTRTEDTPDPEESTCLRGLSQDARDGWSDALAFYRDRLSELFLRGDEMAAVRERFLDPDSEAGGELVDTIFEHLERAAPAYRACLSPYVPRDMTGRSWDCDNQRQTSRASLRRSRRVSRYHPLTARSRTVCVRGFCTRRNPSGRL